MRERTADLERALDDLAASNAALAHARDAADAARRRLGDAIEALDEGFAIFDTDDRLVLCNRTYLSLWPTIADRIQPGVAFDESPVRSARWDRRSARSCRRRAGCPSASAAIRSPMAGR